MPDLTKMSVEELCDNYVAAICEANARHIQTGIPDPYSVHNGRSECQAIIAELTRRTEVPAGHVKLDDGRVVKFETGYWLADDENSACENLEEIADGMDDQQVFEVIPLLILPRELYVAEVCSDGTGTHRPASDDEIAAYKAGEASWRERAKVLPDPAALAAKGVERE